MSFLGVGQKSCEGIEQILENVPHKRHLLPTRVWHLRVNMGWSTRNTTYVKDMRLLFVRSGRGWYWIEGVEFPISRNTIILLNTGTTFELLRDEHAPPHIVACRFGLRDNVSGEVVPSAAAPFHVAYNTSEATAIEPYFVMLANAFYHRDDQCQRNLQTACLHCILGRIRSELESLAQVSDPRIESGRQHLAANPLAVICWEDLAQSVGLSRDYFCRCFTKELGISPKSYHLKVKMEYAQFLLESSGSSIQEVAEMLGYSDPFVFSRQFKRTRGVNPSEIRKRRMI